MPTDGRRGNASGRASLRARIRLWNAAVITATLAFFTAAGVFEERRQALRAEAASAETLLGHLAAMPEFRADVETARRQLGALGAGARAVGGRINLVPSTEGPAEGDEWLVRRRLSLAEGPFELGYRSDPQRLARITRRAIWMHSLHGLLAIGALVAGTEVILRRGLIAPLRAAAHQLERIRDGGGWLAHVPAADAELAGLMGAVSGLGPGLESQVREWLVAERRAAAVLALRGVRGRLRELEGRARGLAEEFLGGRGRDARDHAEALRSLAQGLASLSASLEQGEKAAVGREDDAALGMGRAG